MIILSPERQQLLRLAASQQSLSRHSAPSSLASSFNAGTAAMVGTAPATRQFEVVSEMLQLTGYQTYIVEQWVPDRQRLFKTATVYTGDKRHQLYVAAVRVEPDTRSKDDQDIFAQLMEQFDEDKARPVVTPVGTVMVTSLGAVSSQLNIILVADGDYEQLIPTFHLNLNLRRLGCSGRSALGIVPPNAVQRQRFIQLYKTLDSVDLAVAVMELMKLTQASLCILGYLAASAVDGVFCDGTAAAVRLFTEDFGPFETETQAAMGDPTVFVAIIGKVVEYRIRLHTLGHQCPKNPFEDIDGFIAALTAFQKSMKMELSGYLDVKSMEKLKDVYQRVAPTAGKVTKHGHVRVDDIHFLDLESLSKCVNLDVFKQIWGGSKKQQLTGDVILESANFAEGIIQGSKEIGKNFLRNVSNKKPRLPDFNKDRGQTVIKGLRQGVAGSISRFSNTVEGFVDRRRNTSRTPDEDPFKRQYSPERNNLVGTKHDGVVDSDSSASDSGGENDYINQFTGQCLRKSYSDSELCERGAMNGVFETGRRYSCAHAPFEELNVVINETAVDPADVESLWKQQLELVAVVDNIKSVSREYALKLQTLSEIYVNHWQGFSAVESELNGMMDEFNLVQGRVEVLDLKVSKQQYDVAVLQDKWKETNEIVENFDAKVLALHKQVVLGLKAASNYDIQSIVRTIYTTISGWLSTGNINKH